MNSGASKTNDAFRDAEIEVSAEQILNDYDSNEIAADRKYKDKFVQVTGTILNISDTLGNVTMSLKGTNSTHSVMCRMEKSQLDRVATQSKGMTAKLVGTVKGMTLNLYVSMDDCRLR